MMPPRSCSTPGRKPGTSTSVTSGNVEGVAEADEARALVGRVDVERPGLDRRLVGDNSDHHALDPSEADDEVLGEPSVRLEEFAGVDDVLDDGAHVHRLVRIVGDQRADCVVLARA